MIGKRVSFSMFGEDGYGIVVDAGHLPRMVLVYAWRTRWCGIMNVYRDEITGVEE